MQGSKQATSFRRPAASSHHTRAERGKPGELGPVTEYHLSGWAVCYAGLTAIATLLAALRPTAGLAHPIATGALGADLCLCRHCPGLYAEPTTHKTMLLTAIAFNLKKLLKHQPKKMLHLAIALPRPLPEQQFCAAGRGVTAFITRLATANEDRSRVLQQPLHLLNCPFKTSYGPF